MEITLRDILDPLDEPVIVDKPRFLIGRGEGCDLRLKSRMVSREHAELLIDDDAIVRVRDLNSRNGTAVNGMFFASEVPLEDGDVLLVGSVPFQVNIEPSLDDWPAVGAPSEWDALPDRSARDTESLSGAR
jgi:pSer/pThr/pTyr-binding forkhead associated (FHA) protein